MRPSCSDVCSVTKVFFVVSTESGFSNLFCVWPQIDEGIKFLTDEKHPAVRHTYARRCLLRQFASQPMSGPVSQPDNKHLDEVSQGNRGRVLSSKPHRKSKRQTFIHVVLLLRCRDIFYLQNSKLAIVLMLFIRYSFLLFLH